MKGRCMPWFLMAEATAALVQPTFMQMSRTVSPARSIWRSVSRSASSG